MAAKRPTRGRPANPAGAARGAPVLYVRQDAETAAALHVLHQRQPREMTTAELARTALVKAARDLDEPAYLKAYADELRRRSARAKD